LTNSIKMGIIIIMGTIYLLNMIDTNYYKIGVTRRNVKDRLRELQTGCPDEIILVKNFDCEYYRKVEAWLHKKHTTKRVEGEWFILDEGDINQFESDCQKISDTIQLLIEENPFFN